MPRNRSKQSLTAGSSNTTLSSIVSTTISFDLGRRRLDQKRVVTVSRVVAWATSVGAWSFSK
ncbi:hypothetical protein COLO4_22711 [Corchorus olitorius]|uniref:Uncharacterized protein n=1 Tax=Corchorus olitorius TaxID=93759 RepID=A0A1R3IKF7_9ROSI|nr:hypothetical protein COLO4_22711 [Corchorus olitorius]